MEFIRESRKLALKPETGNNQLPNIHYNLAAINSVFMWWIAITLSFDQRGGDGVGVKPVPEIFMTVK